MILHYQHRLIEPYLREYLTLFPVVGVVGPRQSGKSTLLQHELKDYRYVSFDQQAMVDFFYDDPEKFMHQYDHHVIFDEVQKVPEIFSAIKLVVDKDRQACSYRFKSISFHTAYYRIIGWAYGFIDFAAV